MASFKIISIVNGNTIETEGWKWGEDYEGKLVKIAGYKIDSKEQDAFAKRKLEVLLLGKSVELRGPLEAVKGINENEDIVTASVYLNEVDISQYFPELKHA